MQQELPCGVLVVDKPLGWSSMKAVAVVRSAFDRAWQAEHGETLRRKRGRWALKVGHAGTLDPLATGVLVLAVGKATTCIERMMAGAKCYETTVDLSAFTATDDAEGERQEVEVVSLPTQEQIRSVLNDLEGEIEQVPPIYSAVHVDGKRAYALARQGKEVVIESRKVFVEKIEVLDYQWPNLQLRIDCGKGVYIRSLARDIGKALGTGGYLTALRRTLVAPYDLSQAIDPREISEAGLSQRDLLSINM